jgi:hypothetical protein
MLGSPLSGGRISLGSGDMLDGAVEDLATAVRNEFRCLRGMVEPMRIAIGSDPAVDIACPHESERDEDQPGDGLEMLGIFLLVQVFVELVLGQRSDGENEDEAGR